MQALSQTTGYAVEALTFLASSTKDNCLVREIAEHTGIAPAYLAKVIQRLVVGGILVSKRGYKGGIKLARPPEEITIIQIDQAVDINRPADRCLLGMVECSDERACPAHDYWKITRAEIRNQLTNLTLAELVAFENRPKHKRLS